MSLSDFQILQKLGDGSYSSVYKVKRQEDGLEYALKKVKISHLSDREKENALNEVRILASIKHKNVASYKQAFFDEPSSSLCIVMEYADNGDVFQKICQYQQSGGNLFKEKVIWKIFIQTVRGLKALHDLKILHRDMKSANIFLYRDYTAKLGDLNVSKVAKKGLLYTQTGTPYYASPEVWKDQPYDCKSDIWSLGCVLYEMCALVPPFRADDMNGLFKRVLKGSYPQIPSNYSMDMRSVIKSLLQVTPAQRPNTEQILDMPIIVRRIKKYFKDETMNNSVMTAHGAIELESELLKTIKFSKNLFKLKLPQPTYDSIQFATLPSGHTMNVVGGGGGKSLSRNTHGSLSTATGGGTVLPKISISSSSRNNGGALNGNSVKSMVVRGSIEGGLEEGPEADYEQDFEYDDRASQPVIHQAAPQVQHQYQAPTKSSSIRSYSGRHALQGVQKKQTAVVVDNEYGSIGGEVLNTNRSKSTVSYNTETGDTQPTIQKRDIRGIISNASPTSIGAIQQDAPPSKQKKAKSSLSTVVESQQQQQIQVAPAQQQQQPPSTIDEKAELESQYDDDFEQQHPQRAKAAPQKQVHKSGKRTNAVGTAQESVTASMQNQQELIAQAKQRDNSQTSIQDTSVASVKRKISRSPSDQSLEKQSALEHNSVTRSHQPSQLAKNTSVPIKQPIIQVKQQKSPNMDRIVNIYSISKQAASKKKKQYYINMASQQQQSLLLQQQASGGSGLNEDIRVKLRQLREGIGYYEAGMKSSVLNRMDNENPTSRNNSSSVLLPELKGSLSPGQAHYNQNNSIITKKQSLERILRGIGPDTNTSIQRIYRKVFAQPASGLGPMDLSLRQQNVPLKVRPANVYSRNINIGGASTNNTSIIANDLDVQGKSVISRQAPQHLLPL